MLRTAWLAVAGILMLVAVALPAGQAQAQGVIHFASGFREHELTLPSGGRGTVEFEAKMQMSNVRCLQAAKITVPVRLAPFQKWGGASMHPSSLTWQVAALADQPTYAVAVTKLDIAWDVASAPLEDARQEYQATLGDAKIEGGPCVASQEYRYGEPATVRVRLPDRTPPNTFGPIPEMEDEPSVRPSDQAEDSDAVAVPSLGALPLLAVLGLAFLRRRAG